MASKDMSSSFGGTVVKLPPLKTKKPSNNVKTTTTTSTSTSTTTTHHLDPNAILDDMTNFCSKSSNRNTDTNNNNSGGRLNVLEFLNHHFVTEGSLVNALPQLREGLSDRLSGLEDKIQTALQNQADLSEANRKDVAIAKSSITSLTMRIQLVQEKAALSEQAVLQITKDMKRLDYAKQHLSKTITAMKRLHMLLHAVSQLQHIAAASSTDTEPDYRNAAHILDAIHLLQSHFEAYIPSIARIQHIYITIQSLEQQFYTTILFSFRHTGLGLSKALAKMKNTTTYSDAPQLQSFSTLADACHVIAALGLNKKKEFINLFCSDHLEAYSLLFDPNKTTSSNTNTATSNSTLTPAATTLAEKPSLKKDPMMLLNNDDVAVTGSQNPNPASLDQMERRYSWFRRTLRDLDDKFTNVFPLGWNVHYTFTKTFLNMTKAHLETLFSTKKDVNVTILLKALQRTILFEKEMLAWLQRDYQTTFLSTDTNKPRKTKNDNDEEEDDEEEEALEFDDSGKAVVAASAEGIRIKYERKMKERKKKQEKNQSNATQTGTISSNDAESVLGDNDALKKPDPVPTLLGLASSIFDSHMGPYIAQEEEFMEEQLQSTVTDATVDTRGELPVFTSSTNLFVYIKNSITRCTHLTRGQTFFQLYQAFQTTLSKYATQLSKKYPSTSTNNTAMNMIAGVGGAISLPGSNNNNINTANASSSNNNNNNNNIINQYATIKIPPGEETTICHVIDTCEYCADTVEALQDLIKDKIDDVYKSKIDMYEQQECFQDVIAQGLIVLVSGLTQRMEVPIKEMSTNTNWGTLNVVGEESTYVRTMHNAIQPFVLTVRSVLPPTYFRNFCDKFASSFTTTFSNAILKLKRISESGTQQLLLDVYNLKTLLLKLPVITEPSKTSTGTTTSSSFAPKSAGSTIAPAMYTKMVTKQFQRIEILLKLVGTPPELLIDVFKVQWENGSALDLQTVMNLKGMKRNEQAAMLERFGVDPVTAMKGASMGATNNLTENIQALQDKSSDVAAKVNSDLFQMRQKVEDFRRAFR